MLYPSDSDTEPEGDTPLCKKVRYFRKKYDSSGGIDIPLIELKR